MKNPNPNSPDDGISIPAKYTSYLAPLMSSKLYNEVRGSKAERGKPPEVNVTFFLFVSSPSLYVSLTVLPYVSDYLSVCLSNAFCSCCLTFFLFPSFAPSAHPPSLPLSLFLYVFKMSFKCQQVSFNFNLALCL